MPAGGLSGSGIRTGRQDKTRGCVQAGATRARKEKRRSSTQSPSFGLPWEVSHSLVFTYEHEMSSKRESFSAKSPLPTAAGASSGRPAAESTTSLAGNLKCHHVPTNQFSTHVLHLKARAAAGCPEPQLRGRGRGRAHELSARCPQAGAQRSASRHSTSAG